MNVLALYYELNNNIINIHPSINNQINKIHNAIIILYNIYIYVPNTVYIKIKYILLHIILYIIIIYPI